MPPVKKNKTFLYRLMNLLGSSAQYALAKKRVYARANKEPLSLPVSADAVKDILVILPEEPFEALYQVPVMESVIRGFSRSRKVFVCTEEVSLFIRHIQGIDTVLEYRKEEIQPYTSHHQGLIKKLRAFPFSVVFLLEKNPGLALLDCAGQCGATFRVGYHTRDAYPFLNIRLCPRQRGALTEQNAQVLLPFHIPRVQPHKWSLPKDTINEVSHLFSQYNIPRATRLICFDCAYFYTRFGKDATTRLISQLNTHYPNRLFLIIMDRTFWNANLDWIQTLSVPVMADTSLPRITASLYLSTVLISGTSIFYPLAYLLHKKTIGVFPEAEQERYTHNARMQKNVICAQDTLDSDTITAIVNALHAFAFSAQ